MPITTGHSLIESGDYKTEMLIKIEIYQIKTGLTTRKANI